MTKYYKLERYGTDWFIAVKKEKNTIFTISDNYSTININANVLEYWKEDRITKAEYLTALKVVRNELKKLV